MILTTSSQGFMSYEGWWLLNTFIYMYVLFIDFSTFYSLNFSLLSTMEIM